MKNFLVKAFICAEAALYLAFTVMDVFDTGDSRWLKFAGIALCFVVSALLSAKGGEVLVTAAVGLSAAADILLLILDVHYAVGVMLLCLFLCCDVCVGLHNMPSALPEWLQSAARIGMWTFYLPSQVMIVLSGKERDVYEKMQ